MGGGHKEQGESKECKATSLGDVSPCNLFVCFYSLFLTVL